MDRQVIVNLKAKYHTYAYQQCFHATDGEEKVTLAIMLYLILLKHGKLSAKDLYQQRGKICGSKSHQILNQTKNKMPKLSNVDKI